MKVLTSLIFVLFSFSGLCAGATSLESIRGTKLVSLVFVGSKGGLSESSFGHIALRFSPENELGLVDKVVQFVADVPQEHSGLKKYILGSGLAGSYAYNVVAEIDSFYNYKELKTKNEDRDVFVYPLELTASQIESIENYIINFETQDNTPKYRFFNKNCSYFAADAIEVATKADLQVKSHPWRLENEIRQKGLITETPIHFLSLSKKRHQTIELILNSELGAIIEELGGTKTFTSSLASKDFFVKLSSYLKLLTIASQETLRELAVSSYRYLMSFEKEGARKTLKRIIESYKFVPLTFYTKKITIGTAPTVASEIEHKLTIKRGVPTLSLEWKKQSSKKERTSIPLTELVFNSKTNEITKDGVAVAHLIKTRSKQWVATTKLSYSLEFNTEDSSVSVMTHSDLSQVTAKRTFEEFQGKSILSLNNILDFSQGYGSCYAMVKLQKAMNDRLIFLPNRSNTAIEEVDKIELLEKVYGGEYAIIGGFSNIADFTASIEKEALKKLVQDLQSKLHENKASLFWDNLTKRQKINKKGIKQMQSILSAGHSPAMIVALKKPGSFRYEQAGHVVLVLGMTKDEVIGGWKLDIYDPNFGLSQEMTIDEDFKINYSMFRDDYEYTGVLDTVNKKELERDIGIRTLKLNQMRLGSKIRNTGAISLKPYELL
jgi:hypothetical protein